MQVVVVVWWLLFVSALGLVLGSFLNVVIYRLPQGIPLSNPRWSFCPHCKHLIGWYDNLPVLSYVRLGGRCRHCRHHISPQYPLIELLCAIVLLILFDTFFIAGARAGLQPADDLTWRVSTDWPVFLAHVVLFVALLAMSVIDLQFYWVDIRFTHFAALAGFVLHTIWTPAHSMDWHRPFDVTAWVCLVAFVAFAIVWLAMLFQTEKRSPTDHATDDAIPFDHATDENVTHDESSHPAAENDPIAVESESRHHNGNGPAALLIPLVTFTFVWIAILWAGLAGDHAPIGFALRQAVPLMVLVGLLLYGASRHRESDVEIVDAIESEAPAVRSMTLVELAKLAPAILLASLAWWGIRHGLPSRHTLASVLHWRPLDGNWQPLYGLTTAASGYVIAAGIGWSVRIVSNLAFAKEAFATGDIHMMAAAGAVAGWPTVLIGFVLTCFIASIGWLVLLPFKRSRAIPLGPWLTVGFLVTTVFHEPIVESPMIQNVISVTRLLFLENSQKALIGIVS